MKTLEEEVLDLKIAVLKLELEIKDLITKSDKTGQADIYRLKNGQTGETLIDCITGEILLAQILSYIEEDKIKQLMIEIL